jgi:uncharacterized protein (TIGR02302 family)
MAQFSFGGETRALGRAPLRALKLSRMALAAESAARAFWPAFTVACFIAAAALFGVFATLDAGNHRIAVLGVLGLFLAALAWGGLRFRMPSRRAAAGRLDAGDPSRPLAALSDSLAGGRGDRTTQTIWHEHLRRAERAAQRLRAAPPDPRLARFDRWALRLFGPVLVIAGLIGAGGDWADRLGSLLAPPPATAGPGAAAAAREALAEAWAVPPGYTGLPTVYFNKLAANGQAIELPRGSELILRVSDLNGTPELTAPGITGFAGFTDFGGALAEARAVLDASGRIEIAGPDGALAGWNVTVIPDDPPEIWLPREPDATLAGALEVFFGARDDYGVVSAWAEIVPLGGVTKGKGLDLPELSFGLPLPINSRGLEVEDSTIRDFGEHPWAGGWVELRLFAEDGAGQQATAGPVTLRLPGRVFAHPLARALVEQRRDLAVDFGQAVRVLDVLQAVTRAPQDVFGTNTGAYLGTRTAIRRLAGGIAAGDVPGAAPQVVEFLWLAALSLEDGDLSSALERLRAAEEALRRALESGTDEDIRRAMDELRAAIEEYLDEMVRQALERGLEPGQQSPGSQQQLSQQDLQEMLDELQRQAESGLRDQARDMLSQLSRMLENLQAGRPQQGAGQQQMEALQEMIQRQRDLADRTFDALRQQRRDGQLGGQRQPGQQGQQGQGGEQQQGEGQQGQTQRGQGQPGDGQNPGGTGEFGALSAEQEALRRALEDLAEQLPGGGEEARRALEDAARAMGEARDDLDARDPGEAVEDQMEALDRLSEGAQALAEAMQNGQGDTAGRGRGRGTAASEARDREADPFDRPAGSYGAIDGRDTRVPDRSVLDRAREVLNELRRRSSEPNRPRLELDYLERLLEQF